VKQEEVPQDHLPYYQSGRKAIYAVDGEGHFGTVPSSGWSVEDAVTAAAAGEYARQAQDALARARRGETSPLEYHLSDRRLDVAQLAQSARLSACRVRRHFRPQVFARLSSSRLSRYADALGLSPEALRGLPPPEGP